MSNEGIIHEIALAPERRSRRARFGGLAKERNPMKFSMARSLQASLPEPTWLLDCLYSAHVTPHSDCALAVGEEGGVFPPPPGSAWADYFHIMGGIDPGKSPVRDMPPDSERRYAGCM